MEGKHYTLSQFAKRINVHVKTLQTWDRKGIFKARRTPTNRRYYTEQDYEAYLKGGKRTGEASTGDGRVKG